MLPTLEWTKMPETYDGVPEDTSTRPDRGFTYRARVLGGWLVGVWAGKPDSHAWGGGLTFVPDPEGHWNLAPGKK